MKRQLQVDSPYCWLQAVSGLLLHAGFFGVSFSFGIFYVELLEEFPGQESEVAWISGINFGMMMLMSPLTLNMMTYIPARVVCCVGIILGSVALYIASKATTIFVLYLTFGAAHGVAINFCYMGVIWTLRRNFRKHLDLAFGLSSAGTGVGGIMFGFMLPIIIESYGWRGALRIISYVSLSFLLVAVVMIPVKQDLDNEEKKPSVCVKARLKMILPTKPRLKNFRFSIPNAWRNRAFLVLSVTILLCAFVSPIPYCHIVNYAIHQGVQKSAGERLPLFMHIGSLVGRISIGKVSGFRGIRRITLCQIIFLIECLATTLCTVATNTASLTAFSLVFGICDGSFAVLLGIVVDDVFCDKNQGLQAIGQLFQLLAIPYTLGAPLAGWLYTQTGSYHVAFFFCGGILFIASCLISMVRFLLQPVFDTAVLPPPEKIIKSPKYENYGSFVSMPQPASNPLISSRACSFIDLAVEVYGNTRSISNSRLAVYADLYLGAGGLSSRQNCCSSTQDFLKAKDGLRWGKTEYQYTDITNQISGIIEMKNASSLTIQNKVLLSEVHGNDVINKNKEIVDDETMNIYDVMDSGDVTGWFSDVSDSSSLGCVDGTSKSRWSGVSVDDAGYFSAPTPANFVDSDVSSQNDGCKGSLDFIEEDWDDIDEVKEHEIENFKNSVQIQETVGGVYE